MFHGLDDNIEHAGFQYLLSIQTAMRPFSGTKSIPMCVLVGQNGDTSIRSLRSQNGPKVRSCKTTNYVLSPALLSEAKDHISCLYIFTFLLLPIITILHSTNYPIKFHYIINYQSNVMQQAILRVLGES